MWGMHSDFSLDWVEGPLDLPLDPRLEKFFRRYSELVDRPETNLGARCRCVRYRRVKIPLGLAGL
jgi:hypothetical protein